MEQKRSVRLVLKTSDLTANSTTVIGQCDQYRTTFTWYNINLRALLGDLYYQYDYFNLLLGSISCSLSSNAVGQGSADDKLVYVKITGLPFINQSYDQKSGNNGIFTTLTSYTIPITAVTNIQLYNNSSNVATFNKDQDLCNITISFFRVLDDTKPALTAINPQFTFLFTITGIDQADNEYKKNNRI
jgi:hypothetical protein